MMMNNTNGIQTEENIEIKKALGLFIDHWKWFLLSIVIFLAIAYAYLHYYATPMYKINAKVLVQDQQKGGNLLGNSSSALSDFSDLLGTKSSVDNEAQILQTKDLMAAVVKKLELYTAYTEIGKINNVGIYKNTPYVAQLLGNPDSIVDACLLTIISRDDQKVPTRLHIEEKTKGIKRAYDVSVGQSFHTPAGDIILQTTSIDPEPGKGYSISLRSVEDVTNELQSALSVKIPDKLVTTIDLELTSSSRDKGKDVLQALIDQYIQGNIIQRNAFADSTINFINSRLTVVNEELSRIEKGVQNFQQTNNIADIKEQSQAVIDNAPDYIKDLNQAEVQKQITESMLSYLKDEKNNTRPVPSLLNPSDPTFFALLEKYNAAQIQRDRIALTLTDANPHTQNLNEEIENLRNNIVANLENQLKAINITIDKIQSQNAQINTFIKTMPAKERAFLDLSRAQDIEQALFIYLLQKKEEVAVTKASNISSAFMIDSPRAEKKPFSPKKPLIEATALIIALLFPYLFLILKETLNNKVSGTEELSQNGRNVVGEIGHNKTNMALIFKGKNRSILAEQFRTLRANLRFTLGEKDCSVILITSSMSGEGKSFIATNLALAYAMNNKKVLLMELDLRKPRIAKNIGLKSENGFSTYIVSSTDTKSLISKSGIDDNLDIITSGPIPPNPSELLSNPKVKTLMDELKGIYDYIIIDSPPIGLVADAHMLSSYTNISLYIIRQDYTYKQQLQIIDDLIKTQKITPLYTVLNDVKVRHSHKYGYGYGNGYSNGYGYGYGYES